MTLPDYDVSQSRDSYDRKDWPKDKILAGRLISMRKYSKAYEFIEAIHYTTDQKDIVHHTAGMLFVLDLIGGST